MGFGAQHSQSLENWAMMIPGLKVVVPATPGDVVGLMVSAVRDPDPVIIFEHKALFSLSEDVADDHVVPLGEAALRHEGTDVSIITLGAMVHVSLEAARALADDGIHADVLDLRCLAPLDKEAILRTAARSGRILIVEENPRACGWGGEVASILADEGFTLLDAPVVRLTPPAVPIPFANNLEMAYLPNATKVVDAVRKLL